MKKNFNPDSFDCRVCYLKKAQSNSYFAFILFLNSKESNMTLKFTLQQFLYSATILITLIILGGSTFAQQCPNEQIILQETFGQGTQVVSDPYVQNLTYQQTGLLASEATYRVATNTQQKPEWHNSTDHTGNQDGRMLVINGQNEMFYRRIIENSNGFAPGIYGISLYVMNIDQFGICSPDPLVPDISIAIEYRDNFGNWVPLTNSPVTDPPVEQSTTPVWKLISGQSILPPLSNFIPTAIRISITDGTVGGCGNDFAMDDILFGICPEGGPMPVTFLDVSAKQKGSAVAVDWSTSQEINNDRFEVERSANGNTGWQVVASVPGAGTSNEVHHYSSLDAAPLAGLNYYRIRQVDIDGKSDYSKTVNIRMDNGNIRVSLVGNPFVNNFTIKFSGQSREVHARLVDITGKQIASETWNIPGGETSKQFSNLSSLQRGIYVLTIKGREGEVLFNGKVLKQ